jgi:hypothetical protein
MTTDCPETGGGTVPSVQNRNFPSADGKLLNERNLRLLNMFGTDELIDWMCPKCGESFKRPESFFLTDPCYCPHCDERLNMTRLREVIAAYEKDLRDNIQADGAFQ